MLVIKALTKVADGGDESGRVSQKDNLHLGWKKQSWKPFHDGPDPGVIKLLPLS